MDKVVSKNAVKCEAVSSGKNYQNVKSPNHMEDKVVHSISDNDSEMRKSNEKCEEESRGNDSLNDTKGNSDDNDEIVDNYEEEEYEEVEEECQIVDEEEQYEITEEETEETVEGNSHNEVKFEDSVEFEHCSEGSPASIYEEDSQSAIDDMESCNIAISEMDTHSSTERQSIFEDVNESKENEEQPFMHENNSESNMSDDSSTSFYEIESGTDEDIAERNNDVNFDEINKIDSISIQEKGSCTTKEIDNIKNEDLNNMHIKDFFTVDDQESYNINSDINSGNADNSSTSVGNTSEIVKMEDSSDDNKVSNGSFSQKRFCDVGSTETPQKRQRTNQNSETEKKISKSYSSKTEYPNKSVNLSASSSDEEVLPFTKTVSGRLATVNLSYLKSEFTRPLMTALREKKPLTYANGAKLRHKPFTYCILPDFMTPRDYVFKLRNEVIGLYKEHMKKDLFQFSQSLDLGDCTDPYIAMLVNTLKSTALGYLRKTMNIPLTSNVDISFSCYNKTDYLLCHDDQLDSRRIAFIYYLNPVWEEKDGGTLDLFDSVDGEPTKISTSILPSWNQFVFFEVSKVSFHQVSEILGDKQRLSINGWFHGPSLPKLIPRNERLLFSPPYLAEVDVENWLQPKYLETLMHLNIRETFAEESQILLHDFLREDKYNELCAALNDPNVQWTEKGPANKRKFFQASEDSNIPPILRECKNLFCSEAFLVLLSNITARNFHPLCGDDSKMGEVYSCFRKWIPGCYTLLHDRSYSQSFAVHTILYFNASDWDANCGGSTKYVENEGKQAYVEIDPHPNSLALVFFSTKSTGYVQYINNQANKHSAPYFHDIFSIYLEET